MTVYLWKNDVRNPHKMAQTLEEYLENMDMLEETADTLLSEMREELLKKDSEIEELKAENTELSLYVDELVQGRHFDMAERHWARVNQGTCTISYEL